MFRATILCETEKYHADISNMLFQKYINFVFDGMISVSPHITSQSDRYDYASSVCPHPLN